MVLRRVRTCLLRFETANRFSTIWRRPICSTLRRIVRLWTETNAQERWRTAYADHIIDALPEGYDTVLNEESSNISQGEEQLLSIARAMLPDPAILVVDEATASVDTRVLVACGEGIRVTLRAFRSVVQLLPAFQATASAATPVAAGPRSARGVLHDPAM